MYKCNQEKLDQFNTQKLNGERIPPIANGQCVRLVQEWCKAPAPANLTWKQGAKVKGNMTISKGTVIATFKDGKYPNQSHGNHAAIYISQNQVGIVVIDQWAGERGFKRGVDTRTISFRGHGNPSDDGEQYYVVE